MRIQARITLENPSNLTTLKARIKNIKVMMKEVVRTVIITGRRGGTDYLKQRNVGTDVRGSAIKEQ